MQTAQIAYDMPERLIAQEPAAERDAARLLVLEREYGTVTHHTVRDLPDLLGPADVVVLNDSRVLPARLDTRRDTGGALEVLLAEPVGTDGAWRARARAGGRLRVGESLEVADGAGLVLEQAEGDGQWLVTPTGPDLLDVMMRHGRMPLPTYIRRTANDRFDALDRERYQTIYASADGSITAPTGGLHLTDAFFEELRSRLVQYCTVTLHLGLGTLDPVRAPSLGDHHMHAEPYVIPPDTAAMVRDAKKRGKRVLAVGAGTVRALEGAALESSDGLPAAGHGTTSAFVAPGHAFRVVDGVLANFHLPRSARLATVVALGGLNRVRSAYREAVREKYRFYTYGDAMLIA